MLLQKGDRKQMGRKKILGFAVIVLLLGIFLFFFVCSVKTVEIIGNEYYSEDDIKGKLMTEVTDRNAVLFFLRYYMGKGNEVPFIQQTEVELKGCSSVTIRVYEKRMTGCIRNMNEYIYFDKDGTVMEVSKERFSDIPFFTGLKAKEYCLYEKLAVEDDSVFSIILSFSQLIERFKLPVDKVHISSINGVTMYSGNVKILFGKQKMYDAALAELNHMLPKVLELNQAGIIDMRDFKEGQATTVFKPEKKEKKKNKKKK